MIKVQRIAFAVCVAATLVLSACTSSDGSNGSTASSAPNSPASVTAASGGGAASQPTTGSSATEPSGTTSKSGKATVTAAVPGGLPPGVTPHALPTVVANSVQKRKSVNLTTCAKINGGWSATGTAGNTAKSNATFEITIFFTTTSATTIASATTQVMVKPGAAEKWSASAKFKAADVMLCVLRGVG